VNPRLLVTLGFIVLLAVILQVETGVFIDPRNLRALGMQIAVVTIIAMALTFVMVAGHIDVSVAGIVALSGVLGAMTIRAGYGLEVAIVVSIIAGVIVGLVNSSLFLVFGITSLIGTIGTLYVSIGVANLITNGIPITQLPEDFSTMANGLFLGMPIVLPIIAAFYLVFLFVEKSTVLGRHIVALGSNLEAAYDNGVRTARVTVVVFVISGAVAGFAGLLYASRIGSATPALDNDLVFRVIVACVVGGTALTGGKGTVTGTLLGSILIGVINNGLDLMGVSTYWQSIALGALLVIAVAVNGDFGRSIRRVVQSLTSARSKTLNNSVQR
jgi:ribose/xylose/arabinose/galactoside ABC-type transport system permease subunit